MIRNFFVTAIRNFRKNPSHTVLNIVGLGIGLACCLVVFTIINFEYSFDNWHEKKDRIYRFTSISHGNTETNYSGIVPYPTGKLLIENVPEIEKIVEFHGPDDGKFSFTNRDGEFQIFREWGVLMTNENFFDVLDFRLIKGNKSALAEPGKIILSELLAQKYFEGENPLGKIIKMDGSTSLEVVGVVEDAPDNTNLPFTCLVSIATLHQTEPGIWNRWDMTWSYSIYVLTKRETNVSQLNSKIDRIIDDLRGRDSEKRKKTDVLLQPISKIHTDERYGDGNNYVTPSLMIWAFVFLGLLILGTGCLNFINLSTALAARRAKEVGIRKTLGSSKKNLIAHFLTETFLIVFMAISLAISLGQFLLDKFNETASILRYDLQFSNDTLIFAFLLMICVTLFAGFYPSIVLSGYNPIDALKNKINSKKGSGNFNLRRGLIVIQFTLTTVMLISTFIIAEQVDYMKNKDLGFDYSNVVLVETPSESDINPASLMAKLQTKSYVKGSTLAYSSPVFWWNQVSSYKALGEAQTKGSNANIKFIDEDYLEFYDIPIVAGSNITNQYLNDSTFNVLVTKHLLSTLGWNDPNEALGRILFVGGEGYHYKIIGVVEDFNVSSSHVNVQPAILTYDPKEMNLISLKLPHEEIGEYIVDIEATFREFYPNELFEYSVLKSQINDRYEQENSLYTVIKFISALAILLSGMGLYGLVSFMAVSNAKMIGIRKVFGASVNSILGIFTREYVKLMLISFLFAAPASYFLMNVWMQEFAVRIPISISYFIAGFFITLAIALITVTYRSFMAAKANPVKSLRDE